MMNEFTTEMEGSTPNPCARVLFLCIKPSVKTKQ